VTASVAAGAAHDAAGNGNTASTSTDNSVTFDSAAPETGTISAVDGSGKSLKDGGNSNSPAVTFSFTGTDNLTAAAGLTYQCRLDSASEADWAACASPKSYSGLATGSHNLGLRAIDQAGNVDASPATFSWNVGQGAGTASYTLSATVQGTGTVTSNPAGLTCRPTCSRQYPTPTTVVLTATPSSGWVFQRWQGACSGSASTCTVNVSGSVSVVAVFKKR
jgi:hypothetical protein